VEGGVAYAHALPSVPRVQAFSRRLPELRRLRRPHCRRLRRGEL